MTRLVLGVQVPQLSAASRSISLVNRMTVVFVTSGRAPVFIGS